jgi:glycosyltransferase involved in cell wall biosynthesis
VRLDKIIVNKYITYICAADEFNANRLMERYGRKAIIVPYGIDFDFFYKGNGKAAKDKFNLEGKFVLLQVGWISPQKNQLESVRALKKVKEFIPNVKLILAGFDKSQYGTMLKEYVHKNDIQDYVLFTGHLNRVFIRDLYHACDVLLHPVKQQGGWLAPFEALCASKPIIVSYEMTASNIIKREKIGIVTNDFVKAILDIYNNPLPYQEMARKGKLWVADNLSWDKFGEKMVAVFWRALYVEKGKGSH